MTTPRIVSLAALAASLLFIVLTITQANGLTVPNDGAGLQAFCDVGGNAEFCTSASLMR
ncbi:hypothetical protein [Pelagibacterium halotolerans]|uniref:hypothetical protein n=1 Tax=Pelagibacterium halotolerans TaxID=531813 RepID=UPI00384ED9E8